LILEEGPSALIIPDPRDQNIHQQIGLFPKLFPICIGLPTVFLILPYCQYGPDQQERKPG
jgi:hypothetical protein